MSQTLQTFTDKQNDVHQPEEIQKDDYFPDTKYKRAKIHVTQSEIEIKKSREMLTQHAMKKYALSENYLSSLNLDELETAANYGNAKAMYKEEYVDDRNYIESHSGVHNGTFILNPKDPAELKRAQYNNMRIARSISGPRAAKVIRNELSITDRVFNKKAQIKLLLKQLPEDYKAILECINFNDLDKLAVFCQNYYSSRIRRYLLPLIEYRANHLQIFYPLNKIVKDLGLKSSKFYTKYKMELIQAGFLRESASKSQKTAIISRAMQYLFDFRNEEIYFVDDETMAIMRKEISLLYQEFKYEIDSRSNNKAAILVLSVIKRRFSELTLRSLATTLFGDQASNIARSAKNLQTQTNIWLVELPLLLTETDDIVDVITDEIIDEPPVAREITRLSLQEIFDKHLNYLVTIKIMNEQLIVGLPGELVRSHLYSIDESQSLTDWYTAHSEEWVYGSARQLRVRPMKVKSMLEIFKDKRVRILQAPTKFYNNLDWFEELSRQEHVIIDDIRPLITPHVTSSYIEMELEDVLRSELMNTIEREHDLTGNTIEDKILRKHSRLRYEAQLLRFKEKFVNDTTRMQEIFGGGDYAPQFFELMENYGPQIQQEVKEFICGLVDDPAIRVGMIVSDAWYFNQETRNVEANPKWTHPGELALDRIILNSLGIPTKFIAPSPDNPEDVEEYPFEI